MQIEGTQKSCKVWKLDASAIAEHVWNERHQVDWEAAGAHDICKNLYPRCLLESWHIHTQHHTINREHGALLAAYCSLLT